MSNIFNRYGFVYERYSNFKIRSVLLYSSDSIPWVSEWSAKEYTNAVCGDEMLYYGSPLGLSSFYDGYALKREDIWGVL